MKHIFLFVLAFLAPAMLWAQAPEGYYAKANGQKKEALKAAMKDIVGKAKVLEYGSGAGKTWTGFYSTDRLPDNQVRDRYSNEKFYFSSTSTATNASAPAGMNIEHSFPKSWWGGTNNQAYKDLFNLMPCEQRINSSKSNYAMGKVTSAKTDNGSTKVGTGQAGNKQATLWEPADQWKGDFARSYFYMVTSYSNLTWTGEGLTMLQNDEWPTLQAWAYALFLQWNREDPVDQIERDRNEAVYRIQGNRNPFVDFPNLCEYIWGDSINYAFVLPNADGGGGDDPQPGTLTAYDASEILCSIYSKRFDASWSKYKDGCTYTLDVYTRNGTQRTSLDGFPVETTDNTYRVTGLKAKTTYYYTVYVYEGDECVATSNEVRVDMPDVQPVFSASESSISFSTVPNRPSDKQEVTLTMIAVKEAKATVTSTYPFEISTDGDTWTLNLTLTGSSSSFYVRLSAQEDEGTYSGRLTLKCNGVADIVIPLAGTVNEQMAFLETFEQGTKSSYAVGTVKCVAAQWKMSDALIGKDVKANDVMAARIKGGGYIEMEDDKMLGCDSLWLYAAPYGSDANMAMRISYSTDGGTTWTPLAEQVELDAWTRYAFKVAKAGNIRLRIEAVGAKRINVDDIQMSDYSSSAAIDGVSAGQSTRWAVYDLLGRRMKHVSRRGVYIAGGKKLIR